MPMYTIPLFLGVVFAWPVIGVVIFIILDEDAGDMYLFAKRHDKRIVREWHIFVWPYVLYDWYRELKLRE